MKTSVAPDVIRGTPVAAVVAAIILAAGLIICSVVMVCASDKIRHNGSKLRNEREEEREIRNLSKLREERCKITQVSSICNQCAEQEFQTDRTD